MERYEAFVNLDQKADALRASRNENAKKMKGKMEKEVRDALIAEGKRIKDELASIEIELNDIFARRIDASNIEYYYYYSRRIIA